MYLIIVLQLIYFLHNAVTLALTFFFFTRRYLFLMSWWWRSSRCTWTWAPWWTKLWHWHHIILLRGLLTKHLLLLFGAHTSHRKWLIHLLRIHALSSGHLGWRSWVLHHLLLLHHRLLLHKELHIHSWISGLWLIRHHILRYILFMTAFSRRRFWGFTLFLWILIAVNKICLVFTSRSFRSFTTSSTNKTRSWRRAWSWSFPSSTTFCVFRHHVFKSGHSTLALKLVHVHG